MQIQVEHVDKKFGDHYVLNDINISFESGKIYGVIGRNGSGKTVLFKCMTDLMRPTAGRILIDGEAPAQAIRSGLRIGAIIETPGFLPKYSGFRNLLLLAGLRKQITKSEIVSVMRMVGLNPMMRKPVRAYSLGMRQRLGIAQAVMENPEILILDEPMNGLDRDGCKEMRSVFMKQAQEGCLVILASHNREDIVTLCDEVYEIDAGKIIKVEKGVF